MAPCRTQERIAMTSAIEHREPRSEITEILRRLVKDPTFTSINSTALALKVRGEGVSPLCTQPNCLDWECATAINTAPFDHNLKVPGNGFGGTACKCHWTHGQGMVRKVKT